MSNKQRWENGAILKIPLDDVWFIYGQMLPHENCEIAVYDSRTKVDINPNDIIRYPVLFRVAVHKSVYNNGKWIKTGKASIPKDLSQPRETYIEDVISDKFSIYKLGDIRPASKEECIGLDCCAVWEANHVEDRINDHYAGRDCIWLDEFWRT